MAEIFDEFKFISMLKNNEIIEMQRDNKEKLQKAVLATYTFILIFTFTKRIASKHSLCYHAVKKTFLKLNKFMNFVVEF